MLCPLATTPLALSTTLTLTLLFTTTPTLAFPTRTQCRCTIVSDALSAPASSPSPAHWLPSSPSPSASSSSSSAADVCSNLGPQLEDFQLTKPDLYDSYMRSSQVPVSGAQRSPVETTVLLDFAGSRSGKGRPLEESEDPRPTTRPRQRIVCQAEPEPFSAYQSSFLSLWATQLVVVLAVFACIAEGLHLGLRWYVDAPSASCSQVNSVLILSRRMERQSKDSGAQGHGNLRLQGGEKRLLAIPPSNADPESIFSPGADKKLRAYESARYVPVHWTMVKREFSAYDEEDDDEMNRPVM
ncbi:hypothetical protein IQ07DRAFT_13318 [Pyrenochaeta sp. DS3sAY3a]|nr:hypothetical protein IQ07DRAFT_13318 [Pyrenochaeta sp. DS3sAY3a]